MQGHIRKLRGALGETIQYQLPLSEHSVDLNPLIGQTIKLIHSGTIFCVACGKKTSKSFNQGYCYPCFTRLAQCDLCIMKPETCHYAQGTCREPSWGEEFCFQPHIVYLANSSGLKVGITRQNQVPTRWIDQGATQALPILKTASRHLSGLVEVAIAKHISDKSSWQKMLKSRAESIDLIAQRDQIFALCKTELEQLGARFGKQALERLTESKVIELNFPILKYPDKVKSLCLTKTPEVCGILQGIKGQYLLLDSGVINIRKYTGYDVELHC